MASNSTNKRQRTAADTLHISDLPIGFIADVSAYLDKPSRAILAVAFNAPSTSWQNNDLMHQLSPISTAIISAQQWDILDFEDVNKELANKLTDDDICAVLISINAHVNITGHGLNPLRGSVVLQQIDLSLVQKYVNQYPALESKISEEPVMPILESIISSNGCSLKCIMFPMNWRREWERTYPITEFRRRYNQLFRSRDMICSKCNEGIQGIDNWMDHNRNRKICYDCLAAPVCDDCKRDDVANGGFSLQYCATCHKTYCTDVSP